MSQKSDGVPYEATTTPPYEYSDAYRRLPMPKSYLAESIIVMLFCCLPLGLVGLVKGQKVSALYHAGHYEAAKATSAEAERWLYWGVGVGFVISAIWGIVALLK